MIYEEPIDDWISLLLVISPAAWILSIIVALFIGFIVWNYERGKSDIPEARIRGLMESVWLTLAGTVLSGNKRVVKSATRILMIAYWAQALLFVAIFIAAASDAYRSRFLKINGPEQLYQKNIIAHRLIKNQVSPYSPYIADFDLIQGTYKEAIDELKEGNVDAIVSDRNVLKSWASDDCDLFVVGSVFGFYTLTVRFPPDVEKHFIDSVNKGLLRVYEEKNVEQIQKKLHFNWGLRQRLVFR